jgi:murein DD-endopeptidase MepM/ murein hydrolase activator NlpD
MVAEQRLTKRRRRTATAAREAGAGPLASGRRFAVKYVIPLIIPAVIIVLFFCFLQDEEPNMRPEPVQSYASTLDAETKVLLEACPPSDGFDFPVGKPDAKEYFDMRPFGVKNHLGADWNRGFRDDDLGDPVYAISNGIVSFTGDLGGDWGKIVRVIHHVSENAYVESLYAHVRDIYVKPGERVERGQKIGTIGNLGGRERAHLHFEIRSRAGMPVGPGYSKNTNGYLNPTPFIKRHRP